MTKQANSAISDQGGLINSSPSLTKADTTQEEKDGWEECSIVQPPYNIPDLLALYENSNTARACIDILATSTVKNGYNITSSEEDDPNIDEAKEFFDEINPEKTFEEIFKDMIISLETAGSSGIEIARNKADKQTETMYSMPIGTLRVGKKQKKDDGGTLFNTGERFVQIDSIDEAKTYYNKYHADIEDRTEENSYDSELNDVMWFKLANPRGRYYGISPSITLLKSYLLTKYCNEYNINEFERGMLQKFAITVENGRLSKKSIDGIKAFMDELRSSKEWSSIPVLQANGAEAKVKIQKLTQDVKEGSFLNLMKYNREEIYVGFGVPPIMLGITETSSLANQDAQVKKFYDDEIIPLQNMTSKRITNMLRKDKGWENLTFTWNVPDFSDNIKETEIKLKEQEKGILSINEVRKSQGLKAIDGGDEPFINTNFGIVFIKDLENTNSEETMERMINASGEAFVKGLLDYRGSLTKKIKEAAIKNGTDDKSNEPYINE